MVNSIIILILSFLASFGFGVAFEIHEREKLILAGMGGLVTRLAYLVLIALTGNPFVTVLLASFVASLYGSILAKAKHVPVAFFTYPALIPLIPGDLFHYMIASILVGNMPLARTQGMQCVLLLLALSIGSIVSWTTVQSIHRKSFFQEED